MNHCVPDWNFDADLPLTNQKKSMGPDHELVELLWRNGQVVLNSQTHRKQDQPRQALKHDQAPVRGNGSYGNSSNLIQDDETVSWIHNPFEDSFEKEFCSSLFTDLPSAAPPIHNDKVQLEEPNPAQQQTNSMPPPRFQLPGSTQRSKNMKGGDLGAPKAVEGSAMTVGSSHCGSNQVTGVSARPSKDSLHKTISQSERVQAETIEPTLTSSSGGSGSSFGRTYKRKGTDIEESESQSEAAELESATGNKSSRRSGSARRSRAAEVHNLSERRRRDRINEKMKALQELIPHCNKTDKASMLDEAIEYLKSLQLQLQVMWMGGGMGPMMFPGVQHYISRMSMGMGSPSLASMPNPMLSRVPLVDQSMSVAQAPNQAVMCQTPVMNQMQNPALSEQYTRYMGFHQMQTTPQPMNVNMFRFGPQAMQQSQPIAPQGNSNGPFGGGGPTNDALTGKTS